MSALASQLQRLNVLIDETVHQNGAILELLQSRLVSLCVRRSQLLDQGGNNASANHPQCAVAWADQHHRTDHPNQHHSRNQNNPIHTGNTESYSSPPSSNNNYTVPPTRPPIATSTPKQPRNHHEGLPCCPAPGLPRGPTYPNECITCTPPTADRAISPKVGHQSRPSPSRPTSEAGDYVGNSPRNTPLKLGFQEIRCPECNARFGISFEIFHLQ